MFNRGSPREFPRAPTVFGSFSRDFPRHPWYSTVLPESPRYSSVSQHMVPRQHPRYSAVSHDLPRFPAAIPAGTNSFRGEPHGHTRLFPVSPHGNPRSSIVSHGIPRTAAVSRGNPHEHQRSFTGFRGFPRESSRIPAVFRGSR